MTSRRIEDLERRIAAVESRLADLKSGDTLRLREERFAAILDDVARATGLNCADLTGADRTHAVAAARGLVCWIARQATDLTLSGLGRLLGGRDHTTVRKGITRAEQLRAGDPDFRELSDRLLVNAIHRRKV